MRIPQKLLETKGIQYVPWWLRNQSAKCMQDMKFIVWRACTLSITIGHPQVPWRAKFVAALGAAYVFSPIQLIPTLIPIIGQLDDLCVLFLATKLVRKWTPQEVLAECEARAEPHLFFDPQYELPDTKTLTAGDVN